MSLEAQSTQSHGSGPFTVIKVEGPTGEPPEIVGGSKSYFWRPFNDGGGFTTRFAGFVRSFSPREDDSLLPNVRNADLGAPVRLGKDEDGVERYAYLMGDTGDRDNPDEDGNNRGGFGGLRIAGNAALLAHKSPNGRIVLDGFVKNPKYPARPWELFPVDTPIVRTSLVRNKQGRFNVRDYPDGHARSVVPAGAVMAGGKLVVAWQQMDWADQPPGRWKGEGSFLGEYDLDASTTVDSKVTSSPVVPVDDPGFQQIQLTAHREDGREVVYIVGSAAGRFNDGPRLAKVDAESLLDPSQWRHFDGTGWGSGGAAHTIPGFRNVGEGSSRIVGDRFVMVYTDGELGVVLRSAPLADLNNFSSPQLIVTGSSGPVHGPIDAHWGEPGGPYGGFIEDVDEENRTITVMISRWNLYSVYPVTVHYA